MKKIFSILLSLALYLGAAGKIQAATLYWVGADGANASVASNWSTTNPTSCIAGVTPSGAAPTSADTINFDADCDNGATIDAGFTSSVSVVVLNAGYTGIVTQANPVTVSSTFTTSDGTWNAANQVLTITSTFTMNAGSTFTASSGTTTFSGAFTINGGTFNHNSGTVMFNGAGATLSCNNILFNIVVLNAGSNTKGISSNCSLPLGSNPTASRFILNGTLSGSGTLTLSSHSNYNAGATLSGFSGISSSSTGTFTVAGATLDLSGYSSFVSDGPVAITSGSIALPSGSDLNSSLTISGGTFTAPSGTLTLASALTISGTPTFTANGGTITFDGAGAVLSCNNVTFNLVTFNNSGTKTINSNCTFPLGANPTLAGAGSITLNGTLSGSGTLSKSTATTLTLNTGSVLSGFSGINMLGSSALTVAGGTMDFSSYTSFVTGTGTVTLSSGSLSLPSGADINLALTISGGTFTAPTGTMSVGGNLTISGSSTFNANGGTITFDGGSATLSCNNVVFNSVTFAHTSSIKTINSNCSFPLGNNPTIPRQITLNGTLSGSGLLTFMVGPHRFNAGSVLSGFTGIDTSVATFNLEGATIDLSAYTTFIAGNVNINSGSISLPNGTDINGNLVIASGTFNAPSGTMTVGGSLTISGTPTFNANGGTIIIDGSSGGTWTCNNATFSSISFQHTNTLKSISNGCTLPIGNNPIIPGPIHLLGSLVGSGKLTMSHTPTYALQISSTGVLSGFDALDITRLNLAAGASLNLSNYNNATFGLLNVFGGSNFTAPKTMYARDIFYVSGTFNHNNGTVYLTGTDNILDTPQSGTDLTFYNLVKDSQGSVTFPRYSLFNKKVVVENELVLKGTEESLLSLKSPVAGSEWQIDARGSRLLQYLTVQDSRNVHGTAMTALCSEDLGNNTGWLFPPCGGAIFNLVSPTDRSYTRDERPTFSWRPPSERSFFEAAREYSLIVDNGNGSDFVVEGIPAGRQNGTNIYEFDKYRVEYLNWDNDDLSDNLISLKTKSSASWSQDFNDGKLSEGKRHWRVQFKDSSNTIYEMSNELYVDFTPPTTTLTKINTLNYVPAVLTSDITPTIFGKVIDELKGSPEDRKVAAAPKNIEIKIEKKTATGFTTELTDTILLTKNYWQADGSEILDNTKNTSDKYSAFEYTPTKPLPAGTYKITLTPRDQTDNAYASQIFQIRVASYGDVLGAMTEEQEQTYQRQITEKSELTIPDPNEDQEKLSEEFNQEINKQKIKPDETSYQKEKNNWLYVSLTGLVFAFLIWILLFWRRKKKKKTASNLS